MHPSNFVPKSSHLGKIVCVFLLKFVKWAKSGPGGVWNTPATVVQRKTTTGKESAFKTGEKHQTTCRSFGFGTVDEWFAYWLFKTQCGGRQQDGVFPLGELADFRRETNGEPSGSVDKELFTSFLNLKNVFPVAVLLRVMLRSVLNRQGTPISLILHFFTKKRRYIQILVRS